LRRWVGAACSPALSEVPHAPQNLNGSGFSAPQLGHRLASELPHSPQNFIPSGFSKPQLAQRIGFFTLLRPALAREKDAGHEGQASLASTPRQKRERQTGALVAGQGGTSEGLPTR